MKLKGYIFFVDGTRIKIDENKDSQYYEMLWDTLNGSNLNISGYLILKEGN